MEWIDSIEQVVDGLTKVGGRKSFMLEYISPTKEKKKKRKKGGTIRSLVNNRSLQLVCAGAA